MSQHVRRVCILRPDHLGDAVLFSGALRHLRRRFPSAEILYVGSQSSRELLAGCPHVDQFIAWEALTRRITDGLPRVRGRGSLDGAAVALRAWCWCRSDLLLLPVRSPTSEMHRVVRRTPARAKVGIGGDCTNESFASDQDAARNYTHRLALSPDRRWEHELAVTRDFLRLLQIDVSIPDVLPELWLRESDRAWARSAVRPERDALLLAIAPGAASRPTKVYPPSRIADALARLSPKQFSVVVVGSREERDPCAALTQEVGRAPNVRGITNLAGATSIGQLVAMLERADIVLSQETGALHIATALGRPTVAIMGGGHFGRFYPWGDPARHRTARVDLECFRCNWHCRFDAMRCIQEIPPMVLAAELDAAICSGAASDSIN